MSRREAADDAAGEADIIDLVEVLKRSLKGGGTAPRKRARKTTAKRKKSRKTA